jgi:hypothetical protein
MVNKVLHNFFIINFKNKIFKWKKKKKKKNVNEIEQKIKNIYFEIQFFLVRFFNYFRIFVQFF